MQCGIRTERLIHRDYEIKILPLPLRETTYYLSSAILSAEVLSDNVLQYYCSITEITSTRHSVH